jgi:hypothetical protein
MKKIIILVVGVLATGVFGCNSVRVVQSDLAQGFDWSKYRTFDFSEEVLAHASHGTAIPYAHQIMVQNEVANQLEKRGLSRSTSSPDLIIDLDVDLVEKIQTRQTDLRTDPINYIGQRRFVWRSQEVPVGRYLQGMVSVNMIDRKQEKSVWQAEAGGVMPSNPKRLQRTISEGAEKLFSRLPGQKEE